MRTFVPPSPRSDKAEDSPATLHRSEPATQEAELLAQPGTVRAFAFLARAVRECADKVASAVEGVALEMDRERRGPLSAAARNDHVEIIHTVKALIGGALVDGRDRDLVASRLAGLADELRKHVPEDRGNSHVLDSLDGQTIRARYSHQGRDDAREIAKQLGLAPLPQAPKPKQPRPSRELGDAAGDGSGNARRSLRRDRRK